MMSPDENARQGLKPLRRIACVRCRRRKTRCDHALPVCGACKKAGLECVQSGVTRHSSSSVTVPLAYLRQLENRVRERPSNETETQESTDGYQVVDGDATGADLDLSGLQEEEDETATTSPLDDAQACENDDSGFEAPSEPYIHHVGPLSSQRDTGHMFRAPRLARQQEAVDDMPHEWADHYSSMYFRHIQPQWPCINESKWDQDFRRWKGCASHIDEPQCFLIQLVLAIGALVSSSFRAGCPHVQHAEALYSKALRVGLDEINGSASILLRTQASLLLLLYAFHGPSPDPIEGSLMLVRMNCASLIAESGRHGDDAEIRENVIMTSHILNEVVSSGWTFSQPLMAEMLDDKIFQYASQIQPRPSRPSVFDQLFQLRCIQSRIRHYNKKLRHLDSGDPFRLRCHTRLKAELEDWKASVQAASRRVSTGNPVYHAPDSLFKLYDYSLSILMQDKSLMVALENVSQLVRCCSEACRTFQVSQECDTSMYWTWAALMYQFRLGIMILYCYAMMAPANRDADFPLEEAICGLQDCRKTLLKFSTRWPRSTICLDTFQILSEVIFDGPLFSMSNGSVNLLGYSADLSPHPSCSADDYRKKRLQECVLEMKIQNFHTAVVSLIEEMMNAMQSHEPESTQINFAPTLYDSGLDLFNV